MRRTLTDEDVVAVIGVDEAVTAAEVARRVAGVNAWRERQNVRNRLDKLVASGRLIVDDDMRPKLYALDQVTA